MRELEIDIDDYSLIEKAEEEYQEEYEVEHFDNLRVYQDCIYEVGI